MTELNKFKNHFLGHYFQFSLVRLTILVQFWRAQKRKTRYIFEILEICSDYY